MSPSVNLRTIPPSASLAYYHLIGDILGMGHDVNPRGKMTKELIGHRSRIDMSRPVVTLPERMLGYRFMPAEAWWILSGDNKVETIAPYSKVISEFSDDGVTFGGAYGPPVVDQVGWCAEQLIKDPLSRQSVLTIWRPRPGRSRDIPCTVALQFLLRSADQDDQFKIYCNATMRSSDAWLGWPYDVFNFSMISGFVAALIMHSNPGFGVKMGALTLTAGSQHLYEPHWDIAEYMYTRNTDCEGPAAYPDIQPLFEYSSFDPGHYWQRPHDLVDHLKALADRNEEGLKSEWLHELIEHDSGQRALFPRER